MPLIKILSRIDTQNYEKESEISEREWNKIIKEVQKDDNYFSSLRVPATKIVYVIQYGYFKHSQRFYPIKAFKKSDLKFVSKVFNISLSSVLFAFSSMIAKSG